MTAIAKPVTYQSIPDYYAGRTVFVTGGSGFVGKVLMEKLLRSCSDIKHIYLLMRPKRGVVVTDRVTKLLASPLFDKLRQVQPNFMDKVSAVQGDMMEPALGLSEADRSTLCREVQVFFHSAATVRFDEKLKLAIDMNLDGVRKVLCLARDMAHLEALVHVSTAYCNCDRENIDEVVYTPAMLPHKLLDAAEWMDEDIFDKLTPKLLGSMPNTYTYTKKMAEYYIADGAGDLPLTIVRPSIIGGTWMEPVPGWVDNFNGPTGILAAVGKGLLRSMRCDGDASADIIPVDVVCNLLVAAGWQAATRKDLGLQVYNCTVGEVNRFSWSLLQELGYKNLMKYPLDNTIRLPNPPFTKSTLWHSLKVVFDQQLPCLLLDLSMYVTGNKAMFTQISNRITKSVSSLEYFTSRGWTFSNKNVFSLYDTLSPSDRKEFNFDVRRLDWHKYMENYCLGLKTYALKEDIDNLHSARHRIKQLQRASFLFNTVLAIVTWRLALKRVKVARTMWIVMLNLASSLFSKLPGIARS